MTRPKSLNGPFAPHDRRRILFIIEIERPINNPDHDNIDDQEYMEIFADKIEMALETENGPTFNISGTVALGGLDPDPTKPRT